MLGRLKERLSPRKTEKRQEKRQRRAMQFEMLERRILPSAGGIIASQMAKQMADAHFAPPAHVRWDSTVDQQTRTASASAPNGGTGSQWAASHHLNMTQARQTWAANQAAGPMSKPNAGSFGPTTSSEKAQAQLDMASRSTVQQIVFVDPTVTDYAQLIQDIVRGNANSQGQQAQGFNNHPWSGQGAGPGQKGLDSNKATTLDDNGTLVVVLNGNEDGIGPDYSGSLPVSECERRLHPFPRGTGTRHPGHFRPGRTVAPKQVRRDFGVELFSCVRCGHPSLRVRRG